MTVAAALQWATDFLHAHGIVNPRLNAEIILCHALSFKRVELALKHDAPIAHEPLAEIERLTTDRATHRPLPYVIGETEFLSLKLKVDARALVPRPETELLVEHTLERLRDCADPRVADIGTGTGAIALSLAHFRREARVVAIDLSAAALALARENAKRLQLHNVEFAQGDLFAPLREREEQFDALCCNLPYVPRAVIETLQTEVREHEPRIALDGGSDGLDLYRRAAAEAPDVLAPHGFIACEMGVGQSAAMREMFESNSRWRSVEIIKDYSGIDRVLIAVNRS